MAIWLVRRLNLDLESCCRSTTEGRGEYSMANFGISASHARFASPNPSIRDDLIDDQRNTLPDSRSVPAGVRSKSNRPAQLDSSSILECRLESSTDI